MCKWPTTFFRVKQMFAGNDTSEYCDTSVESSFTKIHFFLDENSWRKFSNIMFFFFIILITFIHMKKNIGYNYCSFRWFQCVHIPGGGLRAGSYKCVCQKGFYFPDKNSTTKSFPGSELEQAFLNSWYKTTNFSNVEYQCLPCPRGCENCVDDTRCMAEYNVLLRGIPLGIQSFCITVTIVIGIVVLRLRKSKVNASYISVKM